MDVKIFRILSFLLLLLGEFFCFSFILKPMVKERGVIDCYPELFEFSFFRQFSEKVKNVITVIARDNRKNLFFFGIE